MGSNRRKFIGSIGKGAVLGLTAGNVIAAKTCEVLSTPQQPLGPFYPATMPVDTNADMTRVDGRNLSAKGKTVLVKGVVTDDKCTPVKGAIVEVWQACESGKYNHPSDTSGNKLDPNFQYYAMVKTNEKGEYSYLTILPGAYSATNTWVRPPHIHYKVTLRGYEELVTQLYFGGEDLNEHDRILQSLSIEERESVVVTFKTHHMNSHLNGTFNISLKSL
jgi:protocatechuate 3,4-dioxygenase beta subunit